MSLLEKIAENRPAAQPPAEPAAELAAAENGRLTTGVCLNTVAQLGLQIHRLGEAFAKLPDATPQQVDDILAEIQMTAGVVRTKAAKLLAANR